MADNPTEIVKSQEQPAAMPTPMSILAIAVQQNADLDKISKLMDLQERWEKREAEKAFVSALAAFKKNPPEIAKNRKVSYEARGSKVEYKHATLDRVTAGIGAALGSHGLSARWKTAQENGKIRVTCVLQHEKGHAEDTTLEAPPDDTGSKNAVQQIASTVTYLERYTLLAATGMATSDDSDGITFGDAEEMLNSLNSAATVEELQERYNKIYKRAFAAKDKNAMAIAIEAKNRRKQELTGVPTANLPATEDAELQKKILEFHRVAEAAGMNKAQRHMMLGELGLDAALEKAKTLTPVPPADAPAPKKAKKGQKPSEATPAPSTPEPEKQPEFGF